MEFTATHVLRGNVSIDDCARSVRKLLGDRARLEQPDDRTLLARSGSRLAYRLMGARLSGQDLPMRLRLELEPMVGESLVKVTTSSDQGWYLFSTSLAENAYRTRFDRLLDDFKTEGLTLAE